MSLNELNHHYKVIDMMLTAHSRLRDCNKRKAILMDLMLLGSSVVLCAMVFFDSDILIQFQMNQQVVRLVIGLSSVIVFFISLITLRVDWKGQARNHAEAAVRLARCKGECQRILKSEVRPADDDISRTCQECLWMFQMLPEIPEAKFLKLKVLHKRKIEISKMVDNNPGFPVFVLRLKLYYDGLATAFKGRRQEKVKHE